MLKERNYYFLIPSVIKEKSLIKKSDLLNPYKRFDCESFCKFSMKPFNKHIKNKSFKKLWSLKSLLLTNQQDTDRCSNLAAWFLRA